MLAATQALVEQLARPDLLALTPYQSARRIGGQGDVWLNANEYPLDSAVNRYHTPINRYPQAQPEQLIAAYASYAGVSSEQLLVCRGADEGIFLLQQAFCRAYQDSILYCPPTYGMYAISAATLAINRITLATTANWQLDLDQISASLAAQPEIKLIFICNPNNPSGNQINPADLQQLLQLTAQRCLVVVDEAYIEFAPHLTSVAWLQQYPNLVILRTLSKAFALAGLRCGFVLANAPIIALLLKIIAPYPVSTPVVEIATHALSDEGLAQMRWQVQNINSSKLWLQQEASRCAGVLQCFNSYGNYLLMRFADSKAAFATLQKQAIVVRDQSQQPGLDNCLRISIGTIDECQAVLKALQSI